MNFLRIVRKQKIFVDGMGCIFDQAACFVLCKSDERIAVNVNQFLMFSISISLLLI